MAFHIAGAIQLAHTQTEEVRSLAGIPFGISVGLALIGFALLVYAAPGPAAR